MTGLMDDPYEFAQVDNPRGIISNWRSGFVLHYTFFSQKRKWLYIGVGSYSEDLDKGGWPLGPASFDKELSNSKYIRRRGTDQCTMAFKWNRADGYILRRWLGVSMMQSDAMVHIDYVGGGVVRVRPDGDRNGSVYHGLRKYFECAIDPL